MYVGSLECDVLLGDVHSLKAKRQVVRPIVVELRRRYAVAAAEAGYADRHRRSLLGVATVSSDAVHCREVLEDCERLVAGHPEIELCSVRRRMFGEDDESEVDGYG